MAITFVAVGATATAGSGNISPGLPAGIQQDDYQILVVDAMDNVTVTLPGSWTKFAEGNNTAGQRSTFASNKFNTGDTAPTVTHTAGGTVGGYIMAFRSVNTLDVISTLQSNASAVNIAVPGMTPTVADFAVVVVGNKVNSSTAPDSTLLTGESLTWALGIAVDLGGLLPMTFQYAIKSGAAGAIASKTFTTGGTAQISQGLMFSLMPVGANTGLGMVV